MKNETYSMDIEGVESHFGIKRQTLYKWIHSGKLLRGTHYLKPYAKPLILCEPFKQFLKEEDERAWK